MATTAKAAVNTGPDASRARRRPRQSRARQTAQAIREAFEHELLEHGCERLSIRQITSLTSQALMISDRPPDPVRSQRRLRRGLPGASGAAGVPAPSAGGLRPLMQPASSSPHPSVRRTKGQRITRVGSRPG